MTAIPDKLAHWYAAHVLRRAVSCRASGVREASRLTCQSAVSELTAHPGSAGSGLASGCGNAVFSGRRCGEYRDSSCCPTHRPRRIPRDRGLSVGLCGYAAQLAAKIMSAGVNPAITMW